MKNKIIIGYSTNRDEQFQKKFNSEIKKTIGCKCEVYSVFNNGSNSLAKVYNSIWCSPIYNENDIMLFIHHDIHFKTDKWGKELLKLFNSQSDVHIVGVAGTELLYKHGIWYLGEEGKLDNIFLWGKVSHNTGSKKWKSNFSSDKKCKSLQPVVAIDGIFIAFDPDECEYFDEDIFTGFHYYDISFSIKNIIAGKNVFVTEKIHIEHESIGKLSSAWEIERQKFIQRYPEVYQINK